jgi:hypothetical protein
MILYPAGDRACRPNRPLRPGRPVLMVVEGSHDLEFLKRISRLLHASDPRLPDLEHEAAQGKLLLVPAGGANLGPWALGLEMLALLELHIYDREMSPETSVRQRLVASLQARPNCRAFLTRKRSLENYLHPAAIGEATGIELTFGDDDSVASLLACALHAVQPRHVSWEDLSPRTRKRLRERSKHVLNTRAVEQMTLARLTERDGAGEIIGWLSALAVLLESN